MDASPNWAEIVSAFFAIIAACATTWAAFEARKASQAAAASVNISSKDSEFSICMELKKVADELWREYQEIDVLNRDLINEKYLKILNHTEWVCIYFISRGVHTSEPVKHLEEELIKPIVTQLKKEENSPFSLASFIKSNIEDDLTYKALRIRLKHHDFDFDFVHLKGSG